MTNADLDQIYGQFLGMGHNAALRALYTIGYANGAGTPIDSNLTDLAKASTKPTTVQLTAVVTNKRISKPD
jgi:hypothetical protein